MNKDKWQIEKHLQLTSHIYQKLLQIDKWKHQWLKEKWARIAHETGNTDALPHSLQKMQIKATETIFFYLTNWQESKCLIRQTPVEDTGPLIHG